MLSATCDLSDSFRPRTVHLCGIIVSSVTVSRSATRLCAKYQSSSTLSASISLEDLPLGKK